MYELEKATQEEMIQDAQRVNPIRMDLQFNYEVQEDQTNYWGYSDYFIK